MIARIWHGKAAVAKADAYMQYFHKTGLADYQASEGNKGIFVLRKDGDIRGVCAGDARTNTPILPPTA